MHNTYGRYKDLGVWVKSMVESELRLRGGGDAMRSTYRDVLAKTIEENFDIVIKPKK